MSTRKRIEIIPQVGRIIYPESHTGSPVCLMDSGGGERSTGKQIEICLATYNIQSMAKDEKVYELEEELQKVKWDILGLSEIKRRGEQCIDLNSGNRLYYKGKEDVTHGGVGFLIREKLKTNIEIFKAISDRVAYIIIKNNNLRMKIIQTYAPTSSHEDEEYEIFLEELTIAIEETKLKPTIIMGDFNAKIGTKTDEAETRIGDYGYGSRNDRGERLVQYLQQNNLYAINTFFKKKPNRKWTWVSPSGDTKNEIDYFISSERLIFKDVTALNQFSTGSDHRMLRAIVRVNKKLIRKQHFKNTTQIDAYILKEKAEEFRTILKDTIIQSENTENDVNIVSNNLKKSLVEAGIKVAKRKREKQKRISNETKTLMNQRRELLNKGKRHSEEYNKLNKTIRKKIKDDIRKYNESKIEKIIEMNRGVKCLKPTLGRPKIITMKDKNGREEREKQKIEKIITKYYEDLYESKMAPDHNIRESVSKTIRNVNSEELPNIENYEIEQAIKELKNNKAAGPDEVIAEMLKEGKDVIINTMRILLNDCLHNAVIPDEWHESVVILLHKKGDKTDLNNYRPISLLSQMYKVFMKIITNRLTPKMDAYQPVEQAGFRKGFSTSDHLLTIRTLIEKATEYHLPLYLAFVDYEKAFDSVELWAVEQAMNNCRIDSRYRQLIHNIYEKASVAIQLEEKTRKIPIRRGVRQGDVISPKLFTLALEDVFRSLQWTKYGININGKKMSHLRYADDVILTAASFEELQTMIKELEEASRRVGLRMNIGKTKVMTNVQEEDRDVRIDNCTLENVNEYVYLGQILKLGKENQTAEIHRRIRLAWAGFGKLAFILKNPKLPQYQKSRVFDQCVLPILAYGCQTWTLTKANLDKIAKTQRSMERIMLGIRLTDRKTNLWIRGKTKVRDVVEYVATAKWTFAGHNARHTDGRWNNLIQNWRPWMGQRKRGRPQMRWGDDLKRIGGFHWKRAALNRAQWREMREAYVQSWTTEG